MFCRSFSGITLFPTEPLADAAVRYKEGEKAPDEHCSSTAGERRESQNSSQRLKEVEYAQMMEETSPTLDSFPQGFLDRGTPLFSKGTGLVLCLEQQGACLHAVPGVGTETEHTLSANNPAP